jgi:hypothetical protein
LKIAPTNPQFTVAVKIEDLGLKGRIIIEARDLRNAEENLLTLLQP